MTKARGSRIGSYEILGLIGVGGMGEVYRARDSRLGRDVAIKVLPEELTQDPDRRARFEREARHLASLSHTHIAAIYGLEETPDGEAALVLELVEGPTLAERLHGGALPVPEALRIAAQIAEALAAAHEAGIVHRDLKPANIKLKAGSSVKVLDFGLAKSLGRGAAPDAGSRTARSGDLTDAGTVLGTPAYSSPEQTRGGEIDRRTDVWAFGCVLYELLTGQRAFPGDSVPDTIAAVLRSDPDWSLLPPDLPPGVLTLLRRCLEKDPARRLRDLGDASALIEDSARPELSGPRAATAPSSVHRKKPMVAVATVGALTVAAAIVAFFFRSLPEGTSVAPAPAPGPATTATGSATGGGGERAVLPNKVAVLPCENQSPDPNDAYFASGLHQDIIQQLGKLRNLTPIPRVTVLQYAESNLSVAEIATELDVRALLDCTVRYADSRVRITAELVDSTGFTTLWQDDYEPSLAEIADVFAVQADIAMNIANALSVVFRPGERELLTRPPTVSTEAYVLYLRALETQENFAKTVELLEQSVAADAAYAAPRGSLAFLWASELINTNYSAAISAESRAAHESKVRDYAERALALDPTAPLARSALGIVEMLNWRWNEAYDRLRQARELTPNDVTQFDLFLLSYLRRHEEALDIVERARELYPNDPANNTLWQGWALGYGGRYDEAAAAFAASVDASPSNQALVARDWLVRMELARGNERAALEQLRLAESIGATERPPLLLPVWAYCYGRLGQADDAQRIFAEMRDREAAGANFGAGGWAMANLAIGDRGRAVEWLETAAAKAARHELDEGFFNLMALRSNTTNDDQLREPELAAVLARITGD